MTGRFIAIVGPSGVGKDSVMLALAEQNPKLLLARRVITRPSDAGGEDFDGVTEAQFTQLEEQGAFALSWAAHGLRYGIPSTVLAALAQGHDVIANLSRGVLLQGQNRFARFETILLTADRDALAKRLKARGRETLEEIEKRLERANFVMPEGIQAYQVDNSGPLDETVGAVLARLYPANA